MSEVVWGMIGTILGAVVVTLLFVGSVLIGDALDRRERGE